MNARLPEGGPSNQPDERHITSGDSPSHQLLDDLMKGPRMWSNYFNDQVQERFPTGGYDRQADPTEARALRKLLGQIRSYEGHWPHKFTPQTVEAFHALELEEPDELAAFNELTFHVINQYTMTHWQKVFDERGAPKLDARSLTAAQVKLAIESMQLLSFQRKQALEFIDAGYIDQPRQDLDTMIALLQLMIDARLEGVEDIVITAAPLLPGDTSTPDFFVFYPNYQNELQVTRLDKEEFGQRGTKGAPGHLAQIALRRTQISSLSFWPEFKDRDALHTFMSARMSLSKELEDRSAIEKSRQVLGEIVRAQVFK